VIPSVDVQPRLDSRSAPREPANDKRRVSRSSGRVCDLSMGGASTITDGGKRICKRVALREEATSDTGGSTSLRWLSLIRAVLGEWGTTGETLPTSLITQRSLRCRLARPADMGVPESDAGKRRG
jgi:hypothetical protein